MKTFINLTFAGLLLSCTPAVQSASMNSFNHYSFGAVGQWMMTRILGIDRDPAAAGFRHFTLRPVADPTHQMTYARGWYNTQYGIIRAGWETMERDFR